VAGQVTKISGMSTNIHFSAKREIQVIKTGEVSTQTQHFKSVWQTPSDATQDIMNAADRFGAYKKWVQDLCKQSPSEGLTHCQEFNQWIQDMTNGGYDIVVESW